VHVERTECTDWRSTRGKAGCQCGCAWVSGVLTNVVSLEQSLDPVEDVDDDVLHVILDRVVLASPCYPDDSLEQAFA